MIFREFFFVARYVDNLAIFVHKYRPIGQKRLRKTGLAVHFANRNEVATIVINVAGNSGPDRKGIILWFNATIRRAVGEIEIEVLIRHLARFFEDVGIRQFVRIGLDGQRVIFLNQVELVLEFVGQVWLPVEAHLADFFDFLLVQGYANWRIVNETNERFHKFIWA